MSEFHFLQPLDVLYLRGNRLFGDSSVTGEAVMPPWPSMAAGALRSQLLTGHGIDVGRFAQGKAVLPDALAQILASHGIDSGQFAQGQKLTGTLAQCLGTPQEPGEFRISHFLLGKYDAHTRVLQDVYLPLPADVVVVAEGGSKKIHTLQPRRLQEAIQSSSPCLQIPVLRTDKQVKPEGGLWLNGEGIQSWLNGQPIHEKHLVESKALWKIDSRLGIALETQSRTTGEGQLYTVDAVALADSVGFVAGIKGANSMLPENGVLRLGGDGRGAQHFKLDWPALQPDWNAIEKSRRFRLMLSTPGLFEQGWLLPGMRQQNGVYLWQTPEFSAKLTTASTSRAETISGWDIANNQPKPALKAVSTASVYWFDQFEGETIALQKLVEHGLFHLDAYPDDKRRAEGFNNIMIGVWP